MKLENCWYFYNGKSYIPFDTYEKLVAYLAQWNYECGTEIKNSKVNLIGCNDNDTATIKTLDNGKITITRIPRTYRIINPSGIPIWNNLIKLDILNYKTKNPKVVLDNLDISIRINRKRFNTKYTFRYDPIPHTGLRYRPYIYCRKIRLMNEKRKGSDPELSEYFRGSRGKNLPNIYDIEPFRDNGNRGWKRQGRNRKQWELGEKRKHSKVYISKNYNKHEQVDIDFTELLKDLRSEKNGTEVKRRMQS